MRIISLPAAALICLACAILVSSAQTQAQQPAAGKPLMLVTWSGLGAITLPQGQGWKPELLTVYDKGNRPVAQFTKGASGITASFIVFENHSGKPSAEGCREDAINPMLQKEGQRISKRVDGTAKTSSGETLATTSYLMDMGSAAHQRNLIGFAGNSKTCLEIHISTVIESAQQEAAMQAVLVDFHPDLAYQASAADYFRLATILFKAEPGLAAPYYKSTLDTMPADASTITYRRIVTDQLVMSLGMSGDLKNSRAVAESAIAADPDYPLNYYNLACADAEQADAVGAKLHLQQAFDRRANIIKGESLPDPTKDQSILKLKTDKAFWAFVETLPKN